MKPIRVIDTNFKFHGEVDLYESFILTRKFYGVGSFELHISDIKKAEILQKDRLIFMPGEYNKAGIIMHAEIKLDDPGAGTLLH